MKKKDYTIINFLYRSLIRLNYHLKRIGVGFSKYYVYSLNLEELNLEEVSSDEELIIRACSREDLPLFGSLKHKFQSDIEDHLLLAAFLKEDWVGYIWISLKPKKVAIIERFLHFKGAYVWGLHVRRGFRQKGIGKKLINQALDEIKNMHKKKEACTVIENLNKPSLKIFENCKFKRVGYVKIYRIGSWEKYQEKIDSEISFQDK